VSVVAVVVTISGVLIQLGGGMMWGELGVLLTVFLIGAQTAPLSSGDVRGCQELKQQTSFDLDKVSDLLA
jgi:hypothetical protein